MKAPSIAARIAAARLHRQFLVDTSPHRTAADVVRALGAVQSQDFTGGTWAIGMRTAGLTEAGINAAFDRGDIVRTHVLRPTWHFVHPADLRWMLALTGPRVELLLKSYNRKLELDDAVFRKSHKVIEKALTKHGPLTRTQLKDELTRARIHTEGTQRLAHLMMQAELDAIVCSGPRVGKQATYALAAERLPRMPTFDRDRALHDIAMRYFASRAPATVQDMSWWSGLTIADCKRGIEAAGDALMSTKLDDTAYIVSHDFELPSAIPATAHLLPNYDEFFIGFRNRSAIGERLSRTDSVTGGNALIAHVVTIDGQLVGGWRRSVNKSGTTVDLQIVDKLRPAERTRLRHAIARFAEFVGTPVTTRGLPGVR